VPARRDPRRMPEHRRVQQAQPTKLQNAAPSPEQKTRRCAGGDVSGVPRDASRVAAAAASCGAQHSCSAASLRRHAPRLRCSGRARAAAPAPSSGSTEGSTHVTAASRARNRQQQQAAHTQARPGQGGAKHAPSGDAATALGGAVAAAAAPASQVCHARAQPLRATHERRLQARSRRNAQRRRRSTGSRRMLPRAPRRAPRRRSSGAQRCAAPRQRQAVSPATHDACLVTTKRTAREASLRCG
jgi:hypothetical protein